MQEKLSSVSRRTIFCLLMISYALYGLGLNLLKIYATASAPTVTRASCTWIQWRPSTSGCDVSLDGHSLSHQALNTCVSGQ